MLLSVEESEADAVHVCVGDILAEGATDKDDDTEWVNDNESISDSLEEIDLVAVRSSDSVIVLEGENDSDVELVGVSDVDSVNVGDFVRVG